MKNFYKHYIYASFFGNFQHFNPKSILFTYGFCETIRVYLYTPTQRRIFQRLNVFLTLEQNEGFSAKKIAKTRVKKPENGGLPRSRNRKNESLFATKSRAKKWAVFDHQNQAANSENLTTPTIKKFSFRQPMRPTFPSAQAERPAKNCEHRVKKWKIFAARRSNNEE